MSTYKLVENVLFIFQLLNNCIDQAELIKQLELPLGLDQLLALLPQCPG